MTVHRIAPSLSDRLQDVLGRDDFIQLVLSRPLSPSAGSHKITVRPVELADGRRYQWTTRSGSQERHDNLTAEAFIDRATQAFGTAFGDVHLYTTQADISGRAHGGGQVRWKIKPSTKSQPSVVEHNREKQYLIPAGKPCPFLAEIGVMTATGQVRATMSAKFRQINRYLEFIEDILPHLPTDRPVRVVDFGCGKSYLTFALHHFLAAIHQRPVQITGLDLKADVISHCSTVAEKLHCEGLEFRAGDIAGYRPEGPVDLAISLHACDTATDDALAAAVTWNCRVIFAVPCCQHEIHQSLRSDTIPGLTDYGLIRERFAALATDALRAQYLEAAGYKTQVLEFIDLEHTPKNILIRAVRRKDADQIAAKRARQKIANLKSLLKIESFRLDVLPEAGRVDEGIDSEALR